MGFYVEHVGLPGCSRLRAGNHAALGVVGVWMGMFADWAVRAVLFYWRMVTGRWLWKYPRSEPQSVKSQLCRNKRQNADYFSKRFQI